MGDRPIQVGSHYHFVEVNPQLLFDRAKAFFKKLDIAAGTAVRFEPGESKTVVLVAIGGKQIVHGGNNITSSSGLTCTASPEQRDQAAAVAAQKGFGHQNQPDALPNASLEPFSISREAYAAMYGPTTGDLIRLADTDLWIRIEKDLTTYGDELKFGGGKTVRENMGQAGGVKDEAALDLVITNALIVDWSGIYKVSLQSRSAIKLPRLTVLPHRRPTLVSRRGTSSALARQVTLTLWTASRQGWSWASPQR